MSMEMPEQYKWDGEAWGLAHTATRMLYEIRKTWDYPSSRIERSVFEECQENPEIQELCRAYRDATTEKKKAVAQKQLEVLLRQVFSYLLTQ